MNGLLKIRKWFSASATLLLLFTAAAKLIAIGQHKRFLAEADGVIPNVTVYFSMVTATVLELVVAALMWWWRRAVAMIACLWLVFTFITYRLAAEALHTPRPCPCLGRILDWSGLPSETLDWIPVLILVYLGAGSALLLASDWWLKSRRPQVNLPS